MSWRRATDEILVQLCLHREETGREQQKPSTQRYPTQPHTGERLETRRIQQKTGEALRDEGVWSAMEFWEQHVHDGCLGETLEGCFGETRTGWHGFFCFFLRIEGGGRSR